MPYSFPRNPPISSGIKTASAHKAWLEQLVDAIEVMQYAQYMAACTTFAKTGDWYRRSDAGHSVIATGPASMRVTLKAGFGYLNAVPFRKHADETSALLVAPVSGPRIDTVAIVGASGRISIHTGLEAASPAAPAIAAGEIKVAEIYHRVGETNIKDADDSTNGYITITWG